jgi:hypothetical protein
VRSNGPGCRAGPSPPRPFASTSMPLAYNLGNFMRTLALPKTAKPWSLTSLREKLIKATFVFPQPASPVEHEALRLFLEDVEIGTDAETLYID